MRGLLAGKEALKAFYARYSAFVNAFLRFITAFAAVFLINQNIGLMPKLSGGLVPLFAGIICAFLPFGAIAFLIGIFLLAQLFAASMEVALITLVFLLIVVLLYYGFQPGDSAYLIVTPILFFLKVPFAVPMILGLTGSLVSVIPMSCGIFLYYVILYVKQNGSFLAGSEQTEITQMLAQVIKNLLANPAMLVMIAACCLGALTVCVLKKLSINYSWGIAIGAGLILQILVVFIGDFRFGANIDIGYYDQAQGNLDESKTVIDEIWDLHPYMTQTQVRSALAGFLFKGEDVYKPVKGLSGGERARVLLGGERGFIRAVCQFCGSVIFLLHRHVSAVNFLCLRRFFSVFPVGTDPRLQFF